MTDPSSVQAQTSAQAQAPAPVPERSYRALLAVPAMGRILLGMVMSRIAGTMVIVALVLFTLRTYDSPQLAGIVAASYGIPGVLLSPIAGALLDRHGRARLIVLDYVVAAAALILLALLALANALPPWLLVAIALASSITQPLSLSGLRSLFPILVPRHLWERANALDSNGYVLAIIVGPPAAASIVGLWGGPVALLVIAVLFVASAAVLVRVPDPETATATSGRLLRDAWDAVAYIWRNATLRALGIAISLVNVGWGVLTIVVPVIVIRQLGQPDAVVGVAFAVTGISGGVSALAFGRIDTRGRERRMLASGILVTAGALGILLVDTGLGAVFLTLALIGLATGPLDIALFTLRQRRTDPAWMGRAFAVSMSINGLGIPVGSVVGGVLEAWIPAALLVSIACGLVAAAAAWWMIPAEEPALGEVEAGAA